MQPNPMNPMMPSKHSQGNRTNPSSQHNQSYQSKPPVQTSKAMTSIISNQSSQPIKINQIKHADNNPCSKTKHMGLDWMWLITLGCLGFSWMGIACTASLIVWFWAGLFYFSRFDSVWLHYIVLDMLWVAFIWFTGVFDFTCLDFTLLDLVSNWLHWLIVCFWIWFLAPLQYDIIRLPYKHWDLARGWMDCLGRVIDVIRLIGAKWFLTLIWIDWFCVNL